MHTYTGHLNPTPPFDFAQSLEFLGRFAGGSGTAVREGQPFTRAVAVSGRTVAFQLESTGSVEVPELEYTLLCEQELDEGAQREVIERIALYLSLYDDLTPFYRLGLEDGRFAPIIRRLYGYHQVKFLSPFEAASWAVLTQRNALPEARKMRAAIMRSYGGSIEVEGVTYWAFPEPASLAAVATEDIATLIQSDQKAGYLHSLASAFEAVSLEYLLTAPYEEIEAWLRSIKGVGEWTATFTLLRGLGRYERVPLSEWRTVEAITNVYAGGKRLSAEALRQLADSYGPWQGYWSHYLRAAT
jgi:DNA-3-methyladenine glycosylase II